MDESTARALDVLMRIVTSHVITVGMWGVMYLGVGVVLILVAKYLPGRKR